MARQLFGLSLSAMLKKILLLYPRERRTRMYGYNYTKLSIKLILESWNKIWGANLQGSLAWGQRGRSGVYKAAGRRQNTSLFATALRAHLDRTLAYARPNPNDFLQILKQNEISEKMNKLVSITIFAWENFCYTCPFPHIFFLSFFSIVLGLLNYVPSGKNPDIALFSIFIFYKNLTASKTQSP